jgi:hypothetical protein
MITRHCGSCRIETVVESTGPFRTPSDIFTGVTDALVAPHLSWMAPDYMDAETQMLLFSFKSFVIRTGRLNILVDACIGNHKERPGKPNCRGWTT